MSKFVNNGLRRVRLNQVIRQFMDFRGRTPLKLDMEWGGGEIRALSANNVQMGRIDFSKEAYLGSDALYQRWMTKGDCEKGDVAFTTEAPLGNVAQIPDGERYILSQRVILLKANKAIAEPAYLFQLFQSEAFQAELVRQSTGSTVLGIQRARLARVEVDILPIPQQRQIAEILSTVDEAIEQAEALIVKYQQVKAGLMHDLFTRGLSPEASAKGDGTWTLRPTRAQAPQLYKESPLGWIPKEWEVIRIADAFEIQLGKMLNKFAKTGKLSASYLGNRAVQWDFVDISAIEVMDFNAYERQKFSLLPGDLLVCEGGDVGRTAMWRGEMDGCYYQKAIHRLRPKSADALPAFMLRFMRFARDNGFFREFTSQSSIAHLTQEKLGSIGTLLPSLDEQKRIADRLDSLDGVIQTEQSKLAKLCHQKQGLMQDLLTGRVRVNVAESASI